MQLLRAREAHGVIVVSDRCGYRYPGAPAPCPQPVVLIIEDGSRRYVFPESWDATNSATVDDLLRMEYRA